jgi:hypothetical protein
MGIYGLMSDNIVKICVEFCLLGYLCTLKGNRYFGETFRLHLEDLRISHVRNQREASSS